MTENEVVCRIKVWLQGRQFESDQIRVCTTKQRGVDIVACRPGEAWAIEAKGTTSSDPQSKRAKQGLPFTDNQIIDRVMKGFFTAAAMAEDSDLKGSRIALAMPRSPVAERYVHKVRGAMQKMQFFMMWVEADKTTISVVDYHGRPLHR